MVGEKGRVGLKKVKESDIDSRFLQSSKYSYEATRQRAITQPTDDEVASGALVVD